jgi:glutathione synthetase-like protein
LEKGNREEQVGWLVRTKGEDVDHEGGVAAGFSVLYSIVAKLAAARLVVVQDKGGIRNLIRDEARVGSESRIESRGTRWTANPRARVPGDESTETRARKRGEVDTQDRIDTERPSRPWKEAA